MSVLFTANAEGLQESEHISCGVVYDHTGKHTQWIIKSKTRLAIIFSIIAGATGLIIWAYKVNTKPADDNPRKNNLWE